MVTNEATACDVVRRVIEQRRGEPLRISGTTDKTIRNAQAVEYTWDAPTSRYVVEHTRIESFPGQLFDDSLFKTVFEPLEAALSGRVPGRFLLSVDVGSVQGLRVKDRSRLQSAIAAWVLQNASGLDGELESEGEGVNTITARPVDVPFDVTLSRSRKSGSLLHVARHAPPSLEQERLSRIRTALDRKCPKLHAVKVAEGRTSVLVLESNDIALANRCDIADALDTALAARGSDAPDEIYL